MNPLQEPVGGRVTRGLRKSLGRSECLEGWDQRSYVLEGARRYLSGRVRVDRLVPGSQGC